MRIHHRVNLKIVAKSNDINHWEETFVDNLKCKDIIPESIMYTVTPGEKNTSSILLLDVPCTTEDSMEVVRQIEPLVPFKYSSISINPKS